MKKGDSVISVTEKFIAVKRKNGEVDIIHIFIEDGKPPRIDKDNIITISFGENTIETVIDGEIGEIKTTTF